MNDERIKQIAEELDSAVPKDGAKVSWQETGLVANRAGLIRMAVEALYAAVCPLQAGREVTDRSLDYLSVFQPVDYDGYQRSHKISRTENVELPKSPPPSRFDKVKGISAAIVVIAIMLFLVASTFVGCVSLINKATGH